MPGGAGVVVDLRPGAWAAAEGGSPVSTPLEQRAEAIFRELGEEISAHYLLANGVPSTVETLKALYIAMACLQFQTGQALRQLGVPYSAVSEPAERLQKRTGMMVLQAPAQGVN
jgi:hypothetical protein